MIPEFVLAYLPFVVALVLGGVVGRLLRRPLQAALVGLGLLGLGYALLEPAQALALAESWGRRALQEALVWLGLPGQWAIYAFTPQWPWLVEAVSQHLVQLGPTAAQPDTLEALAGYLQRSDVGFVLGVLAGLDSR
jgi:hypothetical protein